MEKQFVEKKKIFIYPCKLGKMVLAFFGDFFITFILAVLLFEGLFIQIARPISNYNSKVDQVISLKHSRINILYQNKLLYYESEETKFDFSKSLEYSADLYLKYFSFDENLVQYDVFKNYYIDYKKIDIDELNKIIKLQGEEYFVLENNAYVLKKEYKEAFSHKYIEGDEMSESAKKSYENFVNHYFLRVYDVMISDINVYDLKSIYVNDVTYNSLKKEIEIINNEINNMLVICAFSSYFVAILSVYLAFPLLNQKRRTPAEIIMKIERVDINNFKYLPKKFLISTFLFSLISNGSMIMFIPLMSIEFSKLFLLPMLTTVSIICLMFSLIEFVIILFNKLHRSLKELTTNSILCDSSTLDEYYKEMNYGKK